MSTMGYVTTLTGIEDSATVEFDFKAQKYRTTAGKAEFNDIFTTTRSTSAGRYNQNGLWEVMPPNTARLDYNPITKALRGLLIEEQRTNVMDYTEHLNAVLWGASQTTASTVVSPLPEVAALGHKLWRWTWKNTDTVFWAARTPTFQVGRYTFSYLVGKKDSVIYNYCQLNNPNIGSLTHEINLLTGEAKVGVAGKEIALVEDLGTMWRVKVPVECTAAGGAQVRVGLYKLTTAANRDVFMDWGCPQLELAASALSYVAATTAFSSRSGPATYINSKGLITTAPYNVGREDTYTYDINGAIKPFGLQLESTSVNLLRGTRDMNLSPWTQAGVVSSPYNEIAPDGTRTALRMVEMLDISTPKEVRQLLPVALNSGTSYTLSVYAKPIPGAERRLSIGFSSNTITTPPVASSGVFTISGDGSVTNVLNTSRAVITKAGNGWFRLSFTVDATATAIPTAYITLHGVTGGSTYTGDGSSGCLLWGAQLEAGGYATSTIYSDAVFTGRSTTATYFDSKQVMQTAPIGMARSDAYSPDGLPLGTLLEAASANMITNSRDMSKWSYSRVTLTPCAAVAPDGSLNATYAVANTIGDWHTVVSSGFGTTTNLVYTASVFAKAGTGTNTLRMGLTNANIFSATNTTTFNLKTGVIIGGNGGTITPAGGGWYLCTVTSTAKLDGTSTLSTSPADASGSGQSAGDDINGIYLWGAMVEKGAFSTSYIPTVGVFTGRTTTATYIDQFGVLKTAAAGTERRDAYGFLGGSIYPIGVLRELVGTNLQFPSNGAGMLSPTRATWADSGQYFIDGSSPLFKLAEDGTTSNSHFALPPNKSFGINRQYTTSFYIKAAGRTKLSLQLQNAASWNGATSAVTVDLIAKTATVSGSGKFCSITEMGNGFFRVSATATCATAHSAAGWYPIMLDDGGSQTYTGDGVSGFLIGGWQVELLPEYASVIAPSSYIPTTTGAVTRAVDAYTASAVARAEDVYTTSQTTRPGDVSTSTSTTRVGDTIFTDVAGWYNKAATTVYTEFTPGVIGVGNTCVSVWFRGANNQNLAVIRKDGSVNNISGILTNGSGNIQAQITSVSPIELGTEARTALAWTTNSSAISTKGAPVAFDNSVEVPDPTQLYIGSASNNQQFCNGHVGRILYYPLRLTNPQLEAMTS